MNLGLTAALVCGMFCYTPAAWSGNFPAPTGDPLLTILMKAEGTEERQKIELDLAGLEAMGETEIQTTTIWTEGMQTFVGVSLNVLLERLGVEDGLLLAYAINDYVVRIPVTDAVPDGPIIAYRVNGKEMSVRDKGPLWIIYPYDDDAAYRTEVIYSRSIWQLDRIGFPD